jgi:hypothetical protein
MPGRSPFSLFLVGLIGALGACGHRTAVAPSDAGPPADAHVAADAASPDLTVNPAVPVSGILFEDVHLTTGNPKKINPNTPGATEPDNVVRLYVKSLVKSPPPLLYAWSTDLGQLLSGFGSEIRFKSSVEGLAKVRCRITNTSTGAVLDRELTLTIKKAFQASPLIRGDYVVYNLSPGEVHAVHLPTRTLRNLGDGQVESFDGKHAFCKPHKFGQYKFFLYDVVSGKKTVVATKGMTSAWDHRYLRVAGDRLYWANVSTNYTLYTLYTMDLGGKLEEQIYGPKLIINATLAGKRLVFSTKPLGVYQISNFAYDPSTKTTTALTALDPLGVVKSQDDPWVVLSGLSKYVLLNLKTNEQRKVKTSMPHVVSVQVSKGYYGGHAREAFGSKGEIFLVALDGAHEKRVPFNHNNFMFPDMDGARLVYMHSGDIYLFEGGVGGD